MNLCSGVGVRSATALSLQLVGAANKLAACRALVNSVAGVDCSTQATKVLVVDPDDGRVVADRPGAARGDRQRRRARDRPGGLVGGAARGAGGDRPRRRGGRDLGGGPAARAGGHRRRRAAAAPGRALERHALGARRGRAARRARRRSLGRARGRGAGAVVHGHALGLAAAHRARGRGRGARGAAPARLADRAPLRPRRHRPRRRLGHRLVVDARRGLRGRGARAPPSSSTARCCRTCSARGEAAGRSTRPPPPSSACPEGALVGPGTGDNMGAALGPRPAAGRAGDQPRHVGHRLRGDERARRRPERPDRRLRRRHRRVPAARGDAQLHARRRPGGGLARARARGGGGAHRGHGAALPRRRAHAEPAARRRARSPGCATTPSPGRSCWRPTRARSPRSSRRSSCSPGSARGSIRRPRSC